MSPTRTKSKPLPYFDADKVDAAPEAYQYLDVPDGVLSLGSYAATLGLAAMGGPNRATERPWIPLAMAAKVLVDTLPVARLTLDQWTKHRAFCFWCLLASAATAAMVPLVMPEARAALRTVQGTAALRQGAGALIGRRG
jgi:Vitamin K epoxide reductase family